MQKRTIQKIAFWLGMTVVLGFILSVGIQKGIFERWQLRSANFLYFQEENRTHDDIVIVAIDNKALEMRSASEIGTLQFKKADYAKVIQNIEEAGAAAVGVDVIFSEESDEEDQQALVEVLEKYPDIVIAAEIPYVGQQGLHPLDVFKDANDNQLGSVVFLPDSDNIVRRQHVLMGDGQVPSFAVAVIHAYLGGGSGSIEQNAFMLSKDTVRVGSKKVPPITAPIDDSSRAMINFFGQPGSFQHISMADVYDNNFVDLKTGEEIDLTNKIVLIGEVGTALHDVQSVPLSFGTAMPGVEIHANMVQTYLTQQYLTEQSKISTILVTILLVIIGLGLALWLRVKWSVLALLASLAVYTVITWIQFEYGLIMNLVYPYFALVLSFIIAYLYRYFYQERLARQTQSAFKQYVSPDVVKSILDNPDQLKLGGEKRTLSVFFSDIAGFTSISEKLGAEELVEQLNEYLDEMSEVLLEEDGTIDKYIGDAVMAFWNAPLDQEDHAIRACRAAIEYQRRLKKLNKSRVSRGEIEFGARVGLNTGDMVVGNMGSTKRFDYTVIGDAVNLGARLEGVNKVYGTLIMLSEYTYALAKDDIEVREIDLITVKGKTEPVRIFELLSMKGELDEKKKRIKEAFEKGLDFYRQQRWEQAVEKFRQVLNIDDTDGPSKVYIERCQQLKDEDLPQDWDGVFVLKTK